MVKILSYGLSFTAQKQTEAEIAAINQELQKMIDKVVNYK